MVSEHASPLALVGGVDAGGQNVHVADLARAIAAYGHDVVVHTRRDDPTLPRRVRFADGVWVDHVDAGPAAPIPKDDILPFVPALAGELRRAWQLDPPDVVLSHFWMSGIASAAAAGPLGIPVAHTYHALGIEKRRHQGSADTSPRSRVRLERRLAHDVHHIIATTHSEKRELVRMGANAGNITVVPCGVDLERFDPRGETEPRPGNRPRVVVLSRLVSRKGIGNVVEAMAAVPGVDLVIAGGPPAGLLEDDREAQRFQRLVDALHVGDRVELRGAVRREQVPSLLRSADIVACCPWYEPFGLVAVEAMACGRPVVASAVGGLSETVLDGVTGFHLPPRNPRAIAAAIEDLLADHAARTEMGAAGVVRARRYGWDRVAAETLAVAEHLVDAHLARRPA
jgi:glycosyltransferase involved in cell wall biosynthesis